MADTLLQDFTETTAPSDGDLLYTVVDPSGTPVDRKTTWTTVKSFFKTYFDFIYTPASRLLTINGISHDLSEDRIWNINPGNGGYAANLYLKDTASTDVSGYKQISYVNDIAEVIVSKTVNNNELLIFSYLFEQQIGVTTIDAGTWIANIFGAIDSSSADSYFKFEAYTRTAGGVETTLFSQYSQPVENRIGYEGYLRIPVEIVQPQFTVNATDRLGVRIYASTNAVGNRTLYYKVGDGNATYVTTPLQLRHSQLRELNGDNNYLHITSTEKAGFEVTTNKVTSISGTSTDVQYPSAKLVYDQLAGKQATGSYEVATNKENTTLDTSTTKYPTNRLVKEYADGKVEDNITDGHTTIAPSGNAVFDALALKADTTAVPVKASGAEIDTGTDDAKFATPKAIADSKLSYTDGTETLTNKRINPRLVTAASYTTNTGTLLDISTCDEFVITAQAGALKFNNPSGTPVEGQKLIIRIKDNGTASALTYDTQFRAMGNALPITTVVNKTLYLGLIFNATDTKWDLVAVANEA